MSLPTSRLVGILVAATMTLAATVTAAAAAPRTAAWSPRPATYGVTVDKDIPITMSDGVILYADIYRPADAHGRPVPGRFPVVMMQTPYNKNDETSNSTDLTSTTPAYLVSRGYVYVIVDSRGTGSSQGLWDIASTREQLDGKELVEWAASAQRPWSAGSVGLFGDSYRGMDQVWTAAEHPRGLKAIFPIDTPGDLYRTAGMYAGQISSIDTITGLILVLGLLPPDYAGSDPRAAVATDGTRPSAFANATSGIIDELDGGAQSYDGGYFWYRDGLVQAQRIDVPTFLVGGWYDIAQRDTPLFFQLLLTRHVPVKMLMGPWYHTTFGQGLPAQGVPGINELALRWFDHYVAGRPDPGLGSFGPVVYQTLGQGRWHAASTWPPPGVRYRPLFLAGTAAPGSPGRLQADPATSPGADPLPQQPFSGVCSRSTRTALLGLTPSTPCEGDNRINDLTGLSYDLPVRTPLGFAGPIAAHLYVSTTGRDAFVTVRLEDVAPDGTATQITAGADTLSFRALDPNRTRTSGGLVIWPYHPYTRSSVEVVNPGTVYDWWIEVWPSAALVPPGHHLRLALQTSDAVRSEPTVPHATAMAGALVQIEHGPQERSAVVLPVQP